MRFVRNETRDPGHTAGVFLFLLVSATVFAGGCTSRSASCAGEIEADKADTPTLGQLLDKRSKLNGYYGKLQEEQYQRVLQIYGGKIDANAGIEDAQVNMTRMYCLMAEWNPLMCEKAQLIAVIGEPSRIEEAELIYEFTTSFGHAQWRFRLNRGERVMSVQKD